MRRRVFLALGLVMMAGVWLGPLPQLATRAFSAHMTMHMAVVAVAAPLLALALARGPFDPARLRPALFSAIPASVVELVVVWSWHAPVLHHAARGSDTGLIAEQSTFLLSGLLVWISALGGPPAAAGARAARRAAPWRRDHAARRWSFVPRRRPRAVAHAPAQPSST